MRIKEKLALDYKGLYEHGAVNIVVFGDSVSHGAVNGYIDYENVYWNVLKKRLNQVRSYVPVNIVNSAIAGTTAAVALPRMEQHVLSYHPDLVVICFGLNDVHNALEDYISPLRDMFTKCQLAGCDVIFMTPNMLNTYVADDTPVEYLELAVQTAEIQNNGRMDTYISAAIELANSMGVPVCDCYSMWKTLSETQDITMLLANRINHPTPEMHQLFADALFAMIMDDISFEREISE